MLLLNLDRVCSLRKFVVFSLISFGWALSAMAQQQADPRQLDPQQPTARRNQGEAPQSGQAAQPGQYRLVDAATAVAQGDAQVAQPPFPALSEAEQRYVDQVLDVWEKSTSQINTFECQFKRWDVHVLHEDGAGHVGVVRADACLGKADRGRQRACGEVDLVRRAKPVPV